MTQRNLHRGGADKNLDYTSCSTTSRLAGAYCEGGLRTTLWQAHHS